MPRVMLSAGESSGDSLGAGLVEALREIEGEIEFVGIAGPKMRKAGVEAVAESESLGVMGYSEVIWSLPRILQVFWKAKAALQLGVDLLVVIDAPDFNIRLARKAASLGIPVVFLGSPQVWAWRGERAEEIAHLSREVLCFFPFEPEYYHAHGGKARCIGHPLAVKIPENLEHGKGLSLLPGSRKQEVLELTPVMVEIAQRWVNTHGSAVHIARAPGLGDELFVPFGERVIHHSSIRSALQKSEVALVCSGTATLEVCLYGVPQVVTYKTSGLSYRVAKRKMPLVQHIALPNLLADPFVPEFVQNFDVEDVWAALEAAKSPGAQVEGMRCVRAAVAGGAHKEAAECIVHWLETAKAG